MKSKSVVVFGIVMICFSIVLKEYRFGGNYHSFISWVVLGAATGFLFSLAWLLVLREKKESVNGLPILLSFQASVVFGLTLIFTLGSFGLALIDLGRLTQKNSEAVKAWPREDAKIVSAGIYESVPGKTGPRWWAATWSYTYVFQGKTWMSHSTSAPLSYQLNPKSSSADAKKDAERRPSGSTVIAFVNPLNPGESVLDQKEGNASKISLFTALGMIVLLCSLVGGYVAAKRIKSLSQV